MAVGEGTWPPKKGRGSRGLALDFWTIFSVDGKQLNDFLCACIVQSMYAQVFFEHCFFSSKQFSFFCAELGYMQKKRTVFSGSRDSICFGKPPGFSNAMAPGSITHLPNFQDVAPEFFPELPF
jgi:hypothetical protein